MTGTTIDDNSTDVALGIYTGSSHPLTQVYCYDNDNGAGYGEYEAVLLNSGVTYYIRIAPSNSSLTLDVNTR